VTSGAGGRVLGTAAALWTSHVAPGQQDVRTTFRAGAGDPGLHGPHRGAVLGAKRALSTGILSRGVGRVS
jgi:hypothetical protein